MKAIFAGSVVVKDPQTGSDVELEVMKDPHSGGMFAIDASYLEQVSDKFNSPFNDEMLEAPEAEDGHSDHPVAPTS